MKFGGVLVLVVSLNDGVVFDQQLSQSGGGEAFAVAKMMNYFARTLEARKDMADLLAYLASIK